MFIDREVYTEAIFAKVPNCNPIMLDAGTLMFKRTKRNPLIFFSVIYEELIVLL